MRKIENFIMKIIETMFSNTNIHDSITTIVKNPKNTIAITFTILIIIFSIPIIKHTAFVIEINPFCLYEFNVTGFDGQGVIKNSKIPEPACLQNFNTKQLERITDMDDNAKVEYEKEENLANKDEIKIKYSVEKKVLERNNIKLTTNEKKKEVSGLQSKEEFEKEKKINEQKVTEKTLSTSKNLISDYIEKNTSSYNTYSDPIYLKLRESNCDYTAVDYSVLVNNEKKQYLTALVHDDGVEDGVIEDTKLYTDEECKLIDNEYNSNEKIEFSKGISASYNNQLKKISEKQITSFIEKNKTKNVDFKNYSFQESFILNSDKLVLTYKGIRESKSFGTTDRYSSYLFISFNNVYVDGEKIIDYAVDIKESSYNNTDFTYEQARGEFLNDDDMKTDLKLN